MVGQRLFDPFAQQIVERDQKGGVGGGPIDFKKGPTTTRPNTEGQARVLSN
jgi:hypothetical protein